MTGRFLRSLYVGRMTEYLSGPGVSGVSDAASERSGEVDGDYEPADEWRAWQVGAGAVHAMTDRAVDN